MKGYAGKVAMVDLSTRRTEFQHPDWRFYRELIGGRNMVLHYLLQMAPRIAPLSPANRIVIATSAITSTGFPGTSRLSVGCKSPLSGGFAEGEAGGWFGPELQRAGVDCVVIDGAANEPVFLYIHGGEIEIRSAEAFWGLETAEAHKGILEDVGAQNARALLIGPAGEKLVRFACVASDLHNYCGRGGMGAVWGSKKLKGIAVVGATQPELADPEAIRRHIQWFAHSFPENAGLSSKGKFGTMLGVEPMSVMGLLPTLNFTRGSFAGAHAITGEQLVETLVGGREGCRACPVRCKRVVTGERLDNRYGGPEFESIGSLGSNCGIADPYFVVKANERCNALGLDTISAGVTIAFAMECEQAGLLRDQWPERPNLHFGNGEALLETCELIAKRSGIGDLLAEGSRRAAERIGQGSSEYSMAVKGLEIPAHDPRGKWGVALGYAVSPTGADHLQAAHDTWFERQPAPEIPYTYIDISDLWPFGIYDPMPGASLSGEKVRAFVQLQRWWALHNVLDLCIFVSAPEYRMAGLGVVRELVAAATGWNVLDSELLRAGELSITLARIFNAREGFSAEDDVLPERLHMELPFDSGTHPGIARVEFDAARRTYYELVGWSPDGTPTRAKCLELGILGRCSSWGFAPVEAQRGQGGG